jgi:hypothetical protein
MINATRKEVGSGGSTAARKVRRREAPSQLQIRSRLNQVNCKQSKLSPVVSRFTVKGKDVEPRPLNPRKTGRSDMGQSLVEFALVLPILILIIYGVFDLGRAFYGLVTIANASREGARYMTQHITVMDAGVNNSMNLVKDQVIAEAQGGGIVLVYSNIVVDCIRVYDSSNKITPNCKHGGEGFVRVTFNFRPLFSFIFPASIPIGWETRMRVP